MYKITMHYFKNLYIFFFTLALFLSFFSTTNVKAKAFNISDIEISKPFENNFNKNEVLNIGFRKGFFELINTITKSSDIKKISSIKLSEIKSMINSFSIKEEKFINKTYYVNMGVSFEKKKILKYLEKKNVFPSQITRETFLYLPIIIEENINDVKIFSDNMIYKNWNKFNKKSQLINYLLPTEDLEDIYLIKKNIDSLESYDFEEIIEKYFLENSIISLISKKNNDITILSKIIINGNKVFRSDFFNQIDFDNNDEVEVLIGNLKTIYEDLWKEHNQINTSIRLPLIIKVDNKDLSTSLNFESSLSEIDLISSFSINKFDKDYIFYEVIFNGTHNNFINIMTKNNYQLDTQKKIWILK